MVIMATDADRQREDLRGGTQVSKTVPKSKPPDKLNLHASGFEINAIIRGAQLTLVGGELSVLLWFDWKTN